LWNSYNYQYVVIFLITDKDGILDILSDALKTAPLYRLAFMNVGLEKDGIMFLKRVINTNPYLRNFSFRKNTIADGSEALSLIEAVSKHGGIRIVSLDECGIDSAMLSTNPHIVPTLFRLEAVGLGGNNLGSKGAYLISKCLADNSFINFLDLDDNLFNDHDAMLFAMAMKSNTNLVDLSLRGNNFTNIGISTLYKSIFEYDSLNGISESNHTCELKLFDDGEAITGEIDKEVLLINARQFEPDELPLRSRQLFLANVDNDSGMAVKMLQMDGRKKMKILHALTGGTTNNDHLDMKYLNDMPMELFPEVLALLQDAGKYSDTEKRSLNRLFQMIRSRPGWTSIAG